MRRDEFSQRTVIDRRRELVERLANVDDHADVRPQFAERLERAQARAREHRLGAFENAGQLDVVESASEFVGDGRLLRILECHTNPGRIGCTEAELSEARSAHKLIRCERARVREGLDGSARKSRGCRRWHGKKTQTRKLGQRIQHGYPEHRIAFGKRRPVVQQHVAQSHECVVDLGHVRAKRSLVAQNRFDQVSACRKDRHGEPAQTNFSEAVANGVKARATGAHDERSLVRVCESTNRVDDGLCHTGTRQGAHHDAVSGGDVGDDLLLFGVSIQKQCVSGCRALVLRNQRDVDRSASESVTCGRVASKHIKQGCRQVVRVVGHRLSDVGEDRRDNARRNLEVFDVTSEVVQSVNNRLRFKRAIRVRKRNERVRVERHLELTLERTGEQGVQELRANKLEFEIFAVLTKLHALQQDRSSVHAATESPVCEPDAECDGVDATHRAEFGVLGDDGGGGGTGLTQCRILANKVRQECGLTEDEFGQSARVSLAQIDARARRVVEVQKR